MGPPLLRQVVRRLEGEKSQDANDGEQEHHRVFPNSGFCRPTLMGWRWQALHPAWPCRFLCWRGRGRRGEFGNAWRLGSASTLGLGWSNWRRVGIRVRARRWITHGRAAGDGEDGVTGQEKAAMDRLQTMQGSHDAMLDNKPPRGAARALNSDGEQRCGLGARCEQDVHGNYWKPGFSRG
ncbi:MAG: hypothetical protein TE42_01950 [Candidatus Synechococcus spongiarum SP3]|uniref:Uncharacterized protein n=1 Tax=Candidatus Synechococcus spongiarum SP3 TaxID=1604020 RepID=A0A0G2IWX1_9SYNE|nr:MAG: hypothetical protein TE42_01950 [Candidatus Synechococcus spongiarum SP3]